MAKIQNTDNTKYWYECGTIGTLNSLLVGMQNDIATLEAIWQFLTKLNILLTHNPGITLPGIYAKELKT